MNALDPDFVDQLLAYQSADADEREAQRKRDEREQDSLKSRKKR